MWTAITRAVSPSLGDCELSYLSREPIDVRKAMREHEEYERRLGQLGLSVHSLPAQGDCPDAVFVEDPAVVVDEVAVVTTMGIASRRRERESLAEALRPFRTLKYLREPGRLEGGDVLRVGRTLYVGESRRTNREGREQLSEILSPFGYEVRAVKVTECLHLKTGCTYLGRGLLLANGRWIDAGAFADFEILEVPQAEPWAANALVVGETVLLPEGFPQTRTLIESRGFQVETIDVSELMKAEAGLTCMSVIFKSSAD
jgi:dimethylargininase